MFMKSNYFFERSNKNRKSLANYLEDLPQYCFDFFVGIESKTTPLTRLNYAMDISVFFDYLSKWKFGKEIKQISLQDLATVTSSDIENFISYLSYYEYKDKEYHNGERGKVRKLASVRSFFKYFFNKDRLPFNVASKVETPKLHQKEIIRLETDEVVKILQNAENHEVGLKHQQNYNKNTSVRDLAMLSLFLGTGIRISECVGLNVEDIDFANNAFKITRKGGNQVVLYFSDEVKQALQNWIDYRETLNADTNALFLSLQKKRICTRAVQNLVKKYSLTVNPLKKITPHKLRSTYGTNLYRETKDIYIVADVLGHKDVNTTKRHYAAISEDIRRSAANKVKLR